MRDILLFFSHVTERNLNPKVACLKRREEDKFDEMTARSLAGPSAQDAQQHLSLHNKVVVFCKTYALSIW